MVFTHVLKQGSGHNARLRCILFCIYTCSFALVHAVLCLLYALFCIHKVCMFSDYLSVINYYQT